MTRARANSGFSLIEVMCAMLILGVAIAGLTHGITTALASGKDSETQTVAALCAAGQIEQFRADGIFTDGETEGDCGDNLPLYKWKQTVKSAGLDGLHQITVTVENARSGQPIYELATLLFDSDFPAQDENSNGAKKPGAKKRPRRKS